MSGNPTDCRIIGLWLIIWISSNPLGAWPESQQLATRRGRRRPARSPAVPRWVGRPSEHHPIERRVPPWPARFRPMPRFGAHAQPASRRRCVALARQTRLSAPGLRRPRVNIEQSHPMAQGQSEPRRGINVRNARPMMRMSSDTGSLAENQHRPGHHQYSLPQSFLHSSSFSSPIPSSPHSSTAFSSCNYPGTPLLLPSLRPLLTRAPPPPLVVTLGYLLPALRLPPYHLRATQPSSPPPPSRVTA